MATQASENLQDTDITASGVHALLSKTNPQKALVKETAHVITPM